MACRSVETVEASVVIGLDEPSTEEEDGLMEHHGYVTPSRATPIGAAGLLDRASLSSSNDSYSTAEAAEESGEGSEEDQEVETAILDDDDEEEEGSSDDTPRTPSEENFTTVTETSGRYDMSPSRTSSERRPIMQNGHSNDQASDLERLSVSRTFNPNIVENGHISPSTSSAAEDLNLNGGVSVPLSLMKRFPLASPTPSDHVEQLRETNAQLRVELRAALASNEHSIKIVDENIKLRRQLDELNDYIEKIDSEAEQEFSTISAELDDVRAFSQAQADELRVLREACLVKDKELDKQSRSLDAAKLANQRQKEIIEGMCEEVDAQKQIARRSQNEAETMRTQLYETRSTMRKDKDEHKRKELLFACELDDVQREVKKQRDLLEAGTVNEVIKKWDEKIARLEDELRERDSIIFTQQHLIKELRRKSTGKDESIPGLSK